MTPSATTLDDLLRPAAAIDWADLRHARDPGRELVDRVVTSDGLLAGVIGDIIAGRGAPGACESYPAMDKLVLWQSPDRRLRLRLHVFYPGYADRPHNHRWSFFSRVLGGAYLHSVYGSEDEVLAETGRGGSPRVRLAHQVAAGGEYFLDHSLVHSLNTAETTVSLLLRGPSVKDRYFTVEPAATGAVAWSDGAARETAEQASAKAMTAAGFDRVSAALRRIGMA
jgi:hypothetical protein